MGRKVKTCSTGELCKSNCGEGGRSNGFDWTPCNYDHVVFEDDQPDLTVAIKADEDKIRADLLPVGPMLAIAEVLTFGAKKYADHNWRNGFKWSRLLGAAMRHLFAFLRGEDKDPETGLSHLAHLGCCAMFLLEHEQRGLGEDDRYKS